MKMKLLDKDQLKLGLLIISFLMLAGTTAKAQNDTISYLNQCASDLGTYNYIRSYMADVNPHHKGTRDFSYVFSKGSKYILIACLEDEDGGKMVLDLYNSDHELVASTYDKSTRDNSKDLIFNCSSTGVYYIHASFIDLKQGRGLCILGFTKNNSEN